MASGAAMGTASWKA